MRPLVFIGGGGHCKSVMDIAEKCGYEILGVLDIPEKLGEPVLGYSVIGNDEDICSFLHKASFVITVGQIDNPNLRMALYDKVKRAGGQLETIIARDAVVSDYARIGEGGVVMHHAVVNADAKIGVCGIVNTFANVEHDAEIGDFCHISTGAMVNGGCKVGNRCFIGSGSVLSNGVRIADDILLGAGSFARKNLKISGIYSGNPAVLKIKR